MKARRKANGVAIVGTVETLIGTCKADQESFGIDGNGEMYCLDIGDGTVIDWDSADSKRFEGESMFLDANGDHVKESEIELMSEDGEKKGIDMTPLTDALTGLRENVRNA